MLAAFFTYPAVFFAAALIVVFIGRWLTSPSDRTLSEYALVGSIFTLLISILVQIIANALSPIRPLKYDLFAYRMDALFGQPSFVLGRFAQHHLWIQLVLQVAYGILPNVVALLLAAHIFSARDRVRFLIYAFTLNILAAPLFYALFPVCGPQFAFPHFPAEPGALVPHAIALSAAPNGVPSVHASTALLIVFFARRWRVGLIFGIVYLSLMVFSTLASGQHYFVDLIAAVPYAAIVLVAARRASRTTNTEPAVIATEAPVPAGR